MHKKNRGGPTRLVISRTTLAISCMRAGRGAVTTFYPKQNGRPRILMIVRLQQLRYDRRLFLQSPVLLLAYMPARRHAQQQRLASCHTRRKLAHGTPITFWSQLIDMWSPADPSTDACEEFHLVWGSGLLQRRRCQLGRPVVRCCLRSGNGERRSLGRCCGLWHCCSCRRRQLLSTFEDCNSGDGDSGWRGTCPQRRSGETKRADRWSKYQIL